MDIWTALSDLLQRTQGTRYAESRVTRTPITFRSFGPTATAAGYYDAPILQGHGSMEVNSDVTPMGPTIRHESAHALMAPFMNSVLTEPPSARTDDLRRVLLRLGYPQDTVTRPAQVYNETMGSATDNRGWSALDNTRDGVTENIARVLGKIGSPKVTNQYLRLMVDKYDKDDLERQLGITYGDQK